MDPLQLDSKPPKVPFNDYAHTEARYRILAQTNPEVAERFMTAAQQ